MLSRRHIHARDLQQLRERALPTSEELAFEDLRPTMERLVALAREIEGLIGFRRGEGILDCPELDGMRVTGAASLASQDDSAVGAAARGNELIAGLEDRLAAMRACYERRLQYPKHDKEQLAQFARELELARTELGRRVSWSFERGLDEWRHELLTGLVSGLDELETRAAAVSEQVERASERARLDRGPWEVVRQAIRNDPGYGGLDLRWQADLDPLGRNPQSGLWEFLLVQSGAQPPPDPSAEDPACRAVDEQSGIVLALLPGGRFRMGREADEPDDGGPFAPIHWVELAPFFISKYEITNAQARRLGVTLGADIDSDSSCLPVMLTWTEWSALLPYWGLELPSESQWEYACRGGTTTRFFTGDDPASVEGFSNFADRSWERSIADDWSVRDERHTQFDDGYAELAPVGMFRPNPFGLYDILGNGPEWCRDPIVWRGYSTLPARPGDGLRETIMRIGERVLRGGAWWTPPEGLRSSNRGLAAMGTYHGARPVRRIR